MSCALSKCDEFKRVKSMKWNENNFELYDFLGMYWSEVILYSARFTNSHRVS